LMLGRWALGVWVLGIRCYVLGVGYWVLGVDMFGGRIHIYA
jgi:hypothetical protein